MSFEIIREFFEDQKAYRRLESIYMHLDNWEQMLYYRGKKEAVNKVINVLLKEMKNQ